MNSSNKTITGKTIEELRIELKIIKNQADKDLDIWEKYETIRKRLILSQSVKRKDR